MPPGEFTREPVTAEPQEKHLSTLRVTISQHGKPRALNRKSLPRKKSRGGETTKYRELSMPTSWDTRLCPRPFPADTSLSPRSGHAAQRRGDAPSSPSGCRGGGGGGTGDGGCWRSPTQPTRPWPCRSPSVPAILSGDGPGLSSRSRRAGNRLTSRHRRPRTTARDERTATTPKTLFQSPQNPPRAPLPPGWVIPAPAASAWRSLDGKIHPKSRNGCGTPAETRIPRPPSATKSPVAPEEKTGSRGHLL